jgi:uncharacterized protein
VKWLFLRISVEIRFLSALLPATATVMLHRFSVQNFHSFLGRTEVSFALDGKARLSGWERMDASGSRLATAMAVMGANGSGKTSLVKALVFAAWFARHSFSSDFDAEIPVQPHFGAAEQPTLFEVLAEGRDGRVWRYEIAVTRKRVIREALFQGPGRFSYRFVREWNDSANAYNVKLKDFDFALVEAKRAKPNASLISTAAQFGVPLAMELARVHLRANVSGNGRLLYEPQRDLAQAAAHFRSETTQYAQLVDLLRRWDLGLDDVLLKPYAAQSPGHEPSTVWLPVGVHKDRGGRSHELIFSDESGGTQSALMLLSRLLPVLAGGGIAVIDEFESELHPHMLEPLLDLFAKDSTNPHRAQLLFTCHAAEVMNLLHKSHVMLVEKNTDGESEAWRMDAVKGIRSDDNFYAKYMAGAYGAVPQL